MEPIPKYQTIADRLKRLMEKQQKNSVKDRNEGKDKNGVPIERTNPPHPSHFNQTLQTRCNNQVGLSRSPSTRLIRNSSDISLGRNRQNAVFCTDYSKKNYQVGRVQNRSYLKRASIGPQMQFRGVFQPIRQESDQNQSYYFQEENQMIKHKTLQPSRSVVQFSRPQVNGRVAGRIYRNTQSKDMSQLQRQLDELSKELGIGSS